jgi:xanthine dehydrogenase accessory factor
MSTKRIVQAFEDWRGGADPMVLVTVYETLGSTYSKAGHRILVAANGDYQGLVSGGCLEGDLAERAREVLATATPRAVTYDMRDEADELWGLGVGCNGLIRVLLQPLDPRQGYQPFAAIARHLLNQYPAAVATVIESDLADVQAGATFIRSHRSSENWGCTAPTVERALMEGCDRVLATLTAEYTSEDGLRVLYAPLLPVPRLLVLGAGLDAVPLVNMASELGWRVTVADHRPAYLEKGRFERADRVIVVDPEEMAAAIPLGDIDAILVMSHHLVTDQIYLRQLADVDARYIGVLGPPARRERLLAALGDAGGQLRARLKGPVGLDLGADSPESIALSVLAELQATLNGRTAAPLTLNAPAAKVAAKVGV